MTVLDLQGIASAGGNLIVNGSKYSASLLKSIAVAGLKTKSTLVIKNASKLSGLDCKSIASANPGCVTFDFSE
ncbi:hypothetical protein PGIN_7BTORR_01892 [Porphyromonas gingivalis]|uniref:hypothetical protein n=1 Tax=Porphyromonas gingivalis TaxID=837 RepID=UPI000974F638|nr:hypothetical protein [Porphyromonas gingivalis]SJL26197.1 hypothetical protein PGIN_7BTORR_01892 [Porphyromonas gingivalis]